MRTEPARLGEGPSKSIHDSQAPGPGKPPDSEDVTFQCQDSLVDFWQNCADKWGSCVLL